MEKNRSVPNMKYFPFISPDLYLRNVSCARLSRYVDEEFAYSNKFGMFNFEVASIQKRSSAKIMFNKLSTILMFAN